MSNTGKKIGRRTFLQLTGATALTTLEANIARALAIPANNQTGSIKDVEHIVILMQENRPFDHHFGTLRGVRGFSDPRAVKINLPLKNGTGTTPVSVFLQPAGAANVAAGFSVPGPSDGVDVIPRGPVCGMECRRPHRTLVIELDQEHRAVDTVVEHAIVSRRSDPGETCVIEVRYHLGHPDLRVRLTHVAHVEADQLDQPRLLLR